MRNKREFFPFDKKNIVGGGEGGTPMRESKIEYLSSNKS